MESVARIGKADGRYWASETKLEYEFTPNQYVQFELGPLVSTHVIKNVTDLDNRNNLAMSGFFGEMRYLVLERNASSPLSITLSAEPEWHRIDETSGAHVTNLGLELKVNADLELIKNRLFLGSNLLYEVEGTKDPDHIGAGWRGVDRRRFCGVVVPYHPFSVHRRRGLVSASLRRQLFQCLHGRCNFCRPHSLCQTRPQNIHDRGLECAGVRSRCRSSRLEAKFWRVHAVASQVEISR